VAAPDTGEIVIRADGIGGFTPADQFLGGRRLPFGVATRSGIGVDAAGHVYAVEDRTHRIHRVDR